MVDIIVTGRIVRGHPMTRRTIQKDGKPVLGSDGQPETENYVALAVPKNGTTDWRQTDWGQAIQGQAVQDWPGGEFNAATFAWKILDGDSQVPNRVGKKPADNEGYPGHWIINASTRLGIKCFHNGAYDPMQQIQDEKEIKCGDYGRLFLNVKGNGPSKSPGMYVNPTMFSLDRAGELIIVDTGPSAADAFGAGSTGVYTPSQTSPGVPGAQPAHDLVNGPGAAPPAPGGAGAAPAAPTAPAAEPMYVVNGKQYSKSQLLASNWTEQQIAALPTA